MKTGKPVKDRQIKDAESYHQSFSFPDLVTYQKEFAYGQAKINFSLNEVDRDFIKALRVIAAALEKIKDLPQFKDGAIDFKAICDALGDAETRTDALATIRPPGCEPYPA